MGAVVKVDVSDAWKHPVGTSKPRLSPKRERRLLEELAECRRTLATALARDPKQVSSEKTDDPRMMSRFIAEAYRNHGPADSALRAVFQRYFELRAELALANMRLVAHVAKRYRQRGVRLLRPPSRRVLRPSRGDRPVRPDHQTKLSTYATWWIRQAVQSAVASGAYPVRLAPRHLRQLAQNQDQLDPTVSQNPADLTSRPSPHGSTRQLSRWCRSTRPV